MHNPSGTPHYKAFILEIWVIILDILRSIGYGTLTIHKHYLLFRNDIVYAIECQTVSKDFLESINTHMGNSESSEPAVICSSNVTNAKKVE